MDACRKCNNTNISWSGLWKQCASCGEVLEKEERVISNKLLEENNSLHDIVTLPLKSTLMGKLISGFRLIY